MSDGWVNPKSVIKRRREKRKTLGHKTFGPNRSTDEKENNKPKTEKFNPFAVQVEKSESRSPDSIGLGSTDSYSNDSAEVNGKPKQESEFLSALENHGMVTKLPDAIVPSYEMLFNRRHIARRRATLSHLSDLHDDTARDGFKPQNVLDRQKSLPVDLSIKTKMKFSISDTACVRRIKKEDWSTAIVRAQPDPNKTSQKLASACVYYIWPGTIGKPCYPRYNNDFEPSNHQHRPEYWSEFETTIDSAFASLKSGFLPMFYIFHRQYSVIFYIHDGTSNANDETTQASQTSMASSAVPSCNLRAVIAPVSKGLRERLIREGVKSDPNASEKSTLSPDYKVSRSTSVSSGRPNMEDIDFDLDAKESWDWLIGAQIIKMKTKTIHDTKFHDGTDHADNSEVLEGRQSIQRLVNFLVNLKDAANVEFPPTIVSPVAFTNSKVKQLQVRTTADQISVEGIILPSHQFQINKLIRDIVVKRSSREYEVEYFTDKPTKPLNNYVPGCPPESASDRDMKEWISSKPQSLRQLRWKDNFYYIY